MSLATKYRPKTFDDVVGQMAVIFALKEGKTGIQSLLQKIIDAIKSIIAKIITLVNKK